jgi:hypothetical protein
MTPPRLLAAAYRCQYLALTVVCGGEILELRRSRLPTGDDLSKTLLRHMQKAITDFDCTMLAVEPGSPCFEAASNTGLEVRPLTIKDVERLFLPESAHLTQERLFNRLVAEYPRVARFVKLLPGTLKVATTERWKTVSLLAFGLGLAVSRTM